jgi:hypothetical protein
MSTTEKEYLTDKQFDSYKIILMRKLKQAKLLVLISISLPLLLIASVLLSKSFILSGDVLIDLEHSNALASKIFELTLNNYLVLLIIPVIYGIFTFSRSYSQIKDCKKDLKILDLMKQEKEADLSGRVFDPLADLYKERDKYQARFGGRTLPFLFTGKALDFIFAMLTIGILLSILGGASYLTIDKGVWFWIISIGIWLSLVFLVFVTLFYIYTAIKGLAVEKSKDKTQNYPPSRLKIYDLIIFSLMMLFNFSVISHGYKLIKSDTLDLLSLCQLSVSVLAVLIGLSGISLLIKEHIYWRSSQKIQ